jgi:uncharacterized protein YaaN involved in tellurite resistance
MVDKNENKDNGNKDISKELVNSVEIKPAVRPDGLTDKQAADIESQADKAVQALVNSSGSDVFTAGDQIANVGIQDQKAISSSIALLQERMGNVFYGEQKSKATESLTEDVNKLQTALAKINPADIQREARYRFFKVVPFFGNWLVGVLKSSSDKRLTLQQFVDHLADSLQAGEVILKQDNAQLKVMYSDLEGKQRIVGADAYYAEVLMEKLSDAVATTKDDRKKGSLQKVLFRVATRAQDLRAMENIHEQFFVGIEMTRENNDLLIATVQRMLTMGMNVVYVSFAIHAALKRQQNVLEAEKGTREFIGNMIVGNAVAINNHVKEIGDLYKEPIVAMDKLEKAVEQLEQAIDATNKLKAESIERAKGNIIKIKILTEELKTKSGQLPDTDVRSLEASKMLQLPAGRS